MAIGDDKVGDALRASRAELSAKIHAGTEKFSTGASRQTTGGPISAEAERRNNVGGYKDNPLGTNGKRTTGFRETNWGLSDTTFSSPEAAMAALAAAQANPIIGTHGATGAGYYGSKTTFPITQHGPMGYGVYWRQYGAAVGNVNIQGSPQMPENPGVKTYAVSTYGLPIPISAGRRRLSGNIIAGGKIVPKLVGGYDEYVEYEVPVTNEPPVLS